MAQVLAETLLGGAEALASSDSERLWYLFEQHTNPQIAPPQLPDATAAAAGQARSTASESQDMPITELLATHQAEYLRKHGFSLKQEVLVMRGKYQDVSGVIYVSVTMSMCLCVMCLSVCIYVRCLCVCA